MKKQRIYAMYRGDTFITTGTLTEIAAYCGITYSTARFYLSPTYKRRVKNAAKRLEVFLLDDDDDDE